MRNFLGGRTEVYLAAQTAQGHLVNIVITHWASGAGSGADFGSDPKISDKPGGTSAVGNNGFKVFSNYLRSSSVGGRLSFRELFTASRSSLIMFSTLPRKRLCSASAC